VADETRIVVAEDHPFFRDGVRRALDNVPSLRVIAEAADGLIALGQIRALKPDMAIMDIGLPKMDGVTIVRTIRQERIPLEFIFLTICSDEEIFEAAIELDVKGYLLKECTDAELLRCIAAVSSGHHYTSPAMTTYLVNKTRQVERFAGTRPGLRLLSQQERTILRQIAQDMTSKEIAEEMGIAVKTVDAHRSNICRKLELRGQHVLSRFAARHRTEI
jgi:DNA-binding NarL/FixJ family response regulator